MQNKSFSIGEAVGFGWDKTKSNLGLLIPAMIIYGIVGIFPEAFSENSVVYLILNLVSMLLGFVVFLGIWLISLKLYDDEEVGLGLLFSTFPLLLNYIIATIIVSILVIIGFILLVIPGIYLSIRFMFYPYLIVDRKMGAIESLKKSSELTKGIKLDLLLFNLVIFGIILVGLIALIVGLLVAVPVATLATVFVYRKLLEQTEGQIQVEGEVSPSE